MVRVAPREVAAHRRDDGKSLTLFLFSYVATLFMINAAWAEVPWILQFPSAVG
jgi:hypothetical protein